MRTIEDIHAALQGIVDAAAGRSLTDDEVGQYEALENELKAVQRSEEIRARQEAYHAPAPGLAAPVAPARPDNGLDVAFEAYLRTGRPNADLTLVSNAQGEGQGPEGGYLVPDGFRQKLVDRMKAFGGIANVVETITTGDG